MVELPVVDLSGDPDRLRAVLREVTHEVGFFYLTGHGVSQRLVDEVLSAAHRLFALPAEDKDAIAMVRSPHFRGFTRLGGELTGGLTDWREQIDVGPERRATAHGKDLDYLWLQGPNQWPKAVPELRAALTSWDAALAAVGRKLLREWAIALGSAGGVFDEAFGSEPATLIKVIRYPARGTTDQGVGAHRDSGVLTLLLAEPDAGGLQVEVDGTWVEAPGRAGAFIVNIGELLERASGGYLRATRHRVTLTGRPRISIAYFFNPRLDARIPTLDLPPELRARTRGAAADPDDPIHATYGENAWKSRLRAHPDVAAAHGHLR
ncbi:putative iron/ascorbate dependent oxidoreductase [Mycolicibacterium phlei]|uniref:isopenicillin N synthase family dioxygenase n=1 Tax=Mycobacteroides chelonae TaxID=1774 RepID=UPI000618C2E6|nr:2-oxoglutarate and iron-dependent oxygenase domain-containing protein [Mycobacteroides chelonae]VEG20318.1 putative iron/ascorbate dependent oxidoreductase [Mycolicibacterium phlei]AKC40672.1 oxidoreductase [Mycobacteroides chelonae]ANB00368.1 oxidoreductase [Mycobacteroides chelonae CCUG 47445]AYM43999.1 isopenicillin N synthase family oxygenase [[Mycobacterium] chelonae subsp. gwanakae]OHU15350.1 oxidoreductase [Mycobacteroides chelonae]